MKKTRIVGLLLVFVLVTSCFVGGTFAKYASTASGSDSAVVARWSIYVEGTEIAVNDTPATITFDLFNTVYEEDINTPEADVAEGYNKVIIAPGTGGKFTLDITNNAEVNAEYKIVLSEANDNAIPLRYSVDQSTWFDSMEELMANDTARAALTANINMATATEETVYWRWAFDNTKNPHAGQTDPYDTALGIAAQGTAPTVTITATITVEQVD